MGVTKQKSDFNYRRDDYNNQMNGGDLQTTREILHGTDLFHAYNDPDDHWDLAVQYGLVKQGFSSLRGIFIDAPCPQFGDPSIMSVAQLNAISALSVPTTVGCESKILIKDDFTGAIEEGKRNSSVQMILQALRESRSKVYIQICGSSRDVAVAGQLEPELFREKCGGIYLNAGTSERNEKLEYNVSIEPYSYYSIFNIPCNIYWLPCFEKMPPPGTGLSADSFQSFTEKGTGGYTPYSKHCTYFRFVQGDLFDAASERLLKYFAYALGRVMDMAWYSYLKLPLNDAVLRYQAARIRNAWGFPAIFHAAGVMVEKDGNLKRLVESTDPSFYFEPIDITCQPDGTTEWRHTEKETNRFLFKIDDPLLYEKAMIAGIRASIASLL